MKNSRAWILGVFFGIIGVIVCSAILIAMAYYLNMIHGIAAIFCGAISGGAVGLGYKIGHGRLRTKYQVSGFLLVATLFGFLGVVGAYYGPYLLFIGTLPIGLYTDLMGIGAMSFIMMAIGAYGGRWAGKTLARSIILNDPKVQAAHEEAVRQQIAQAHATNKTADARKTTAKTAIPKRKRTISLRK